MKEKIIVKVIRAGKVVLSTEKVSPDVVIGSIAYLDKDTHIVLELVSGDSNV